MRAAVFKRVAQTPKAVGAHSHDDVTNGNIKIVSRRYEAECDQRQPGGYDIRSQSRKPGEFFKLGLTEGEKGDLAKYLLSL